MTRFTQSPPLPARVGGWRRLAAGLAAVLMILASAAAAQVRDTLLHMQTDDFDPARRAFEAPAAFKRPAGRSAANGNEYFIVQLTAKPEKSDMTAILAAGWEPLAYVPNNSYIVRARAGSGRALSSLPRYRWSGDLEPGMKLSREVMAKYQAARAGDRVDVVVSAWPGEERKEIARAAQALGAEILRGADPYAYVARLLIRIDAARLPELAAMAEVQWIEPKANITTRNSLVASNVQSGAGTTGMTPIWDRGIHGEGQVIGHIDGELDRNHCFFRDTVNNTPGPGHRKIVGYRGSFGSDFHGTPHGRHRRGQELRRLHR
jgi:subtilisin family serine protease